MKVRPLIKRIVGLTGTPSSNGLMDLWAEFRVLDMGKRLGRFITHYRDEFFLPDKRSAQQVFTYKPKPGAEAEIYRRIGDITISMKSADYLKMPECVMNEVRLAMSDTETDLYMAMKDDLVVTLKGEEIDAVNAAALSGKLCQMANGAIYGEDRHALPIHDRKLDALEDLIEGANGKPVLVAYWFKHDLARIEAWLQKLHIPFSRLDTQDSIARLNRGDLPMALIHPASAGHGLNLQAGGSTLIWFGLTWSLKLYQQTNARLWRQGQRSETVVIHHIITRGTIDEQIMKTLGHGRRAGGLYLFRPHPSASSFFTHCRSNFPHGAISMIRRRRFFAFNRPPIATYIKAIRKMRYRRTLISPAIMIRIKRRRVHSAIAVFRKKSALTGRRQGIGQATRAPFSNTRQFERSI